MPAKSAAYEKGIREGRAMAARSRNPEASEPEEEEEEEEMDMAASHSRKRSAKNAKHTKPAADGYGKKPMDAECGCDRKGKCDGNCGSMRKRSDALTPLEYLDACELGIQDRSPTYIRARLDAAERLDLKCGKGSISEGEKCTKGPATKAQSASDIKRAGRAREMRIAASYKAQRAQEPSVRDIKLAGKKKEASIAAAHKIKMAKLKASGASRQQLREADMKTAMQLAKSYDQTSAQLRARKQRLRESDTNTAMQLAKSYDKTSAQLRARKRRDSIYADGFSADSNSFDI